MIINNVNSLNNYNISVGNTEKKTCANKFQNKQNVPFGDSEGSQNPFSSIKDALLILTNSAVGLAGFNTVLAAMQKFINGKVLIGKINNHFTKNITSEENKKLFKLATEMNEGTGQKLEGKGVKILTDGAKGEAYYTHQGNFVRVGKGENAPLFHELGHAIEENCTNIFKKMQRFRGHYSELSLALYFLMSLRPKKKDYNQDPQNQTFGDKVKNFFSKSDAVIPLLAFSPELITEGKASLEGLKFLKGTLGKDSTLYKNIKKSYITCFLTYLFVPVSIMLLEMLRKSADKAAQKHNVQQSPYYYY